MSRRKSFFSEYAWYAEEEIRAQQRKKRLRMLAALGALGMVTSIGVAWNAGWLFEDRITEVTAVHNGRTTQVRLPDRNRTTETNPANGENKALISSDAEPAARSGCASRDIPLSLTGIAAGDGEARARPATRQVIDLLSSA